eukprot:CAMPEP_0198507370 /NCGR_PEP_ID=MMETSP1462-20131121/12274_1 /TAXON_ID=1333877 /ORGANISM="Brandtodinium nutriculum, Strain RCC3387" /LENGTH=162 /DNA_ID=CAMNT_0044236615 /DNA_START=1 /DNA_END=486 /DNA_ORIENTATION=+
MMSALRKSFATGSDERSTSMNTLEALGKRRDEEIAHFDAEARCLEKEVEAAQVCMMVKLNNFMMSVSSKSIQAANRKKKAPKSTGISFANMKKWKPTKKPTSRFTSLTDSSVHAPTDEEHQSKRAGPQVADLLKVISSQQNEIAELQAKSHLFEKSVSVHRQ